MIYAHSSAPVGFGLKGRIREFVAAIKTARARRAQRAKCPGSNPSRARCETPRSEHHTSNPARCDGEHNSNRNIGNTNPKCFGPDLPPPFCTGGVTKALVDDRHCF